MNIIGYIATKDGKITPCGSTPKVFGNVVYIAGATAPTADQIAAAFAAKAPPVQLSKLGIRRKLRAMGKESAFDSALAAVPNAQKDWDDATCILSNDPLFVANKAALQSAIGLTDDQFNSLLQP
jgi:hypothetical protein